MQWPQLWPSSAVVLTQSSTPLQGNPTSRKMVLPSWLSYLREHYQIKQEPKAPDSQLTMSERVMLIVKIVQWLLLQRTGMLNELHTLTDCIYKWKHLKLCKALCGLIDFRLHTTSITTAFFFYLKCDNTNKVEVRSVSTSSLPSSTCIWISVKSQVCKYVKTTVLTYLQFLFLNVKTDFVK